MNSSPHAPIMIRIIIPTTMQYLSHSFCLTSNTSIEYQLDLTSLSLALQERSNTACHERISRDFNPRPPAALTSTAASCLDVTMSILFGSHSTVSKPLLCSHGTLWTCPRISLEAKRCSRCLPPAYYEGYIEQFMRAHGAS
jgi:hypothetical protein